MSFRGPVVIWLGLGGVRKNTSFVLTYVLSCAGTDSVALTAPRTPSKPKGEGGNKQAPNLTPIQEGKVKFGARRSLDFGKNRELLNNPLNNPFHGGVVVPASVKRVYSMIGETTGSLGGNGATGAIYGELTVGSFQKIVDLLKAHCDLNCNSRFVDVGSGLGKPSFHVAQDPGCQISFGVELEELRWRLSIHNHRSMLRASPQTDCSPPVNVFFFHADMQQAQTFDPFTHVYSCDVGFPPQTFHRLAKVFNCSQTQYLISYQSPKRIIDLYGFKVELVFKEGALRMTGSSEGKTVFAYRRKGLMGGEVPPQLSNAKIDPLFRRGVELTRNAQNGDIEGMEQYLDAQFEEFVAGGRKLRARS